MRLIILSMALALAAPAAERAWRIDLPVLGSLGVRLDPAELDDLRRGDILVKMLDSHRPSEIAVFAGSRVAVGPERFYEALQQSAVLWRGAKVPRTGGFSSPVQAADVTTMQLPAEDVEALRHCRPGDCDVKLAGQEMRRLRAVIDRNRSQWHPAVQAAFRSVVLDRIQAYRRDGLAGLRPFYDHENAVAPHAAFNQLADGSEMS